MKLKFLFSFIALMGTAGFWGGEALGADAAKHSAAPELIIYTYDSFTAPEGLGSVIFPIFEKRYGCKIRSLSSGDGTQILNRLELDAQRGKTLAHLVIGVDQLLWERAKAHLESWKDWEPSDYSYLIRETRLENGFLPYDYGTLTWIADTQKLSQMNLKAPESVSDLLKPEWKKNLILEDPRTSTPGLAFLFFTQIVLEKSTWKFWKQFRTQWLTLTPGWDQAYGLFLKKEAPLVWSYTTSQAYHDSPRYKAIHFREGQPLQVEGAALVKKKQWNSQEYELAKKFLSFMISREVQELVPKKTWMMPVRKDITLPASFQKLPKPTRMIPLKAKSNEINSLLLEWKRAISE